MPGGRSRGGRRTGKVGKAYPQRSDLNGPAPVSGVPNQPYGARGAQEAAQRAVPMGTPDLAPAAAAMPTRPETMPAAGSMGDLFADSQDPSEHVMNGAALGPGLGPEAFGMDPAAQRQQDLESMAVYVPMLMDMAARSGSSSTTRQYLRMLLGNGG